VSDPEDQKAFEAALHELEQAAMEMNGLMIERARHYHQDEEKRQKNLTRFNAARQAVVSMAGFERPAGRSS
jgi:hypothetical protein